MVDWSKPVEAINSDGVVSRAWIGRLGDRRVFHIDTIGPNWYVQEDGAVTHNWSIRNVEPTLRTSDEALRRMERLVERIASRTEVLTSDEAISEARAIQALRAPIDPRLEPVVRSLVANGISEPVARLYARDVLKALDA